MVLFFLKVAAQRYVPRILRSFPCFSEGQRRGSDFPGLAHTCQLLRWDEGSGQIPRGFDACFSEAMGEVPQGRRALCLLVDYLVILVD